MEHLEQIAKTILGAAIRVHSRLGPGLLESAYQKCLAYELQRHDLKVLCETPMPLRYDELVVEVGYRIDMLVEDQIIIENKHVEKLLPVH